LKGGLGGEGVSALGQGSGRQGEDHGQEGEGGGFHRPDRSGSGLAGKCGLGAACQRGASPSAWGSWHE
jgi:hypothetical protein